MFYEIADALGFPGVLNLLRYISFRAGAAVATALLLSLIIGPRLIAWLRTKQGRASRSAKTGRRRTF